MDGGAGWGTGALALAVVAPAAGAQTEPRATVGVTQATNAAGHTVVSHWLETNVVGPKSRVTVLRLPGDAACPADPMTPWTRGMQQLLFSARGAAMELQWDRVVRTVERYPGTWTICTYRVNSDNPRFDMPYVTGSERLTYMVAPRRTAPIRTTWSACRSGAGGRLSALAVTGRPSASACRRAARVAQGWAAEWHRGQARNNWGRGWAVPGSWELRGPNGPPLRFGRVVVDGRAFNCRERTTAPRVNTPLVVECGSQRWRFSLA